MIHLLPPQDLQKLLWTEKLINNRGNSQVKACPEPPAGRSLRKNACRSVTKTSSQMGQINIELYSFRIATHFKLPSKWDIFCC